MAVVVIVNVAAAARAVVVVDDMELRAAVALGTSTPAGGRRLEPTPLKISARAPDNI